MLTRVTYGTKYKHKLTSTMESCNQPQWVALLQSKKRLDRDRGLQELRILVGGVVLEEGEKRKFEEDVLELVTSLSSSWEAKHGGLLAASVLLPHASHDFCEKLKGDVPLLLEYNESRVRLAAGEVSYDNLCMSVTQGRCTHARTHTHAHTH